MGPLLWGPSFGSFFLLKQIYTLLIGLLFSSLVFAEKSQHGTPENLIQKSHELGLASHSTWRKLLHFEETSTGWLSAITSDDFFLSTDGPFDPVAELEATIHSFYENISGDSNKHGQCRFPARWLWLKEQLNLSSNDISEIACPKFEQWSLDGGAESISVVFATGYLGNPASYYGHTLLKMNSKDHDKRTSLLDVSVNYGAIVPDDEDPITYMFKGVFGGYSGGFSHIEYYFHTHNYGENELRDLWEYKLNLPQSDVRFIIAHAWEVLGKEYTYYFFRRNCAYRMAELIEIIPGVDIIPNSPFFTIPQSLIKKLTEATMKGEPLVSATTYHPSRQSRLYQRYQSLNDSQKRLVNDLVADPNRIQSDKSITDYKALDTLLDYYQFIREPESKDLDPSNEAYRKVLAKRFQLPPHPTETIEKPVKTPHEARNPTLFSFGAVYTKSRNTGTVVRIRPAYYDHLDSESAHVKNSALSMADLTFSIHDGNVRVDQFDVINIESANTAVTSLPGDSSEAWRLLAGLERQDVECSDCLVPKFEGAWGRAYNLLPQMDFTGLLGAGVQENRHNQGAVFGSISANIVISVNERIRLKMKATMIKSIDEASSSKSIFAIDARYRLTPSHDVRFSYQDNKEKQLLMTLGSYW